jgi:hypothetical protein
MKHQLDATITVLLISKISSTCFGQTFAHLQEHKTEIFYNIWYNVLLMWQAGFLSIVAWHYVYLTRSACHINRTLYHIL